MDAPNTIDSMNSSPDEARSESPISKLSQKLGCEWIHIQEARASAEKARAQIEQALQKTPILSPDTGLIVFGSLARGELTGGSDVDWTLLVDGAANSDHLNIAQSIQRLLIEERFSEPNPSGAFGALAFSPDLIHQIGGAHDTNANTTRRVLLLLESASIGDDEVRDRVLRGVLGRYLSEDTPFRYGVNEQRTPRFLLNDIVRFWRTMAVDFASKQRERADQKWALRNAKLRLSRKLIFVSGLLMCFRFQRREADTHDAANSEDLLPTLINRLIPDINRTPLDLVAQSVLDLGTRDSTARAIFDAYDGFLCILNNEKTRKHLNDLNYEKAQNDAEFKRVRDLSKQFQDALIALFFDGDPDLCAWMQEYGVF